jgi:TPR repeat protein
MYEHGKGTEIDIAKATHWYREASLGGHLDAMWNYSLLLKRSGETSESRFWGHRSKTLKQKVQ